LLKILDRKRLVSRPKSRALVEHSASLWRGGDAGSVLMFFIAVRLLLPSQFVIGPLGGAGSPALLIGLGCLGWWVLARLQRTTRQYSSPVVGALLILVAAMIASYAVAMTRPINGEEVSVGTLTLIGAAGWFGVMLLAQDGIPNVERLTALVHFVVLLGGLVAMFGLFQFLTGAYWVDQLTIPGLQVHQTIYSATLREGFTRPAGTSVHPIEFGAVMTMILPLALARGGGHLPRPDGSVGNLVARWWPASMIGLAIVLSLSRSAVVGLLVGTIVLLLTWTPRQRIAALAGLAGLLTIVFMVVPGVLGTVLGLFTGISKGDPSITSRVESYAIADAYINQTPFLGRGIGTFLPRYRIFDNQYLLSLVEMGIVGVGALLLLVGVALWCAARAYQTASDERLRGTSAALAAASATGAVSLALFDGFSFPMMPGVWFLLLGLCGCCYRLLRVEHGLQASYLARIDS